MENTQKNAAPGEEAAHNTRLNFTKFREIINWLKPITLAEKLYWLLVLLVGGVQWMR